jgi:hypothetical protein
MAAETPQLKLAREEGEKNLVEQDIPLDPNGRPFIRISCSAAELIPTVQYGNVTVGPTSVVVWVPFGFKGFNDEETNSIKIAIRATQTLCEEAIAEDRQSVHALTRQSTEGRYQD